MNDWAQEPVTLNNKLYKQTQNSFNISISSYRISCKISIFRFTKKKKCRYNEVIWNWNWEQKANILNQYEDEKKKGLKPYQISGFILK